MILIGAGGRLKDNMPLYGVEGVRSEAKDAMRLVLWCCVVASRQASGLHKHNLAGGAPYYRVSADEFTLSEGTAGPRTV